MLGVKRAQIDMGEVERCENEVTLTAKSTRTRKRQEVSVSCRAPQRAAQGTEYLAGVNKGHSLS